MVELNLQDNLDEIIMVTESYKTANLSLQEKLRELKKSVEQLNQDDLLNDSDEPSNLIDDSHVYDWHNQVDNIIDIANIELHPTSRLAPFHGFVTEDENGNNRAVYFSTPGGRKGEQVVVKTLIAALPELINTLDGIIGSDDDELTDFLEITFADIYKPLF